MIYQWPIIHDASQLFFSIIYSWYIYQWPIIHDASHNNYSSYVHSVFICLFIYFATTIYFPPAAFAASFLNFSSCRSCSSLNTTSFGTSLPKNNEPPSLRLCFCWLVSCSSYRCCSYGGGSNKPTLRRWYGRVVNTRGNGGTLIMMRETNSTNSHACSGLNI